MAYHHLYQAPGTAQSPESLQSVPGSVKPLGEGGMAKGMPERTTRLHQKRALELPLEEVPEA